MSKEKELKELHCLVSTDGKGYEGVPMVTHPIKFNTVPLFTDNKEELMKLKDLALMLAKEKGLGLKYVKYVKQEEEILEPQK